jgi:small subunit ribosomal protein S1
MATAIATLIKNEPDVLAVVRESELVEASFLSRTRRAAYFSLRGVGTGIVYGAELSNAREIIKGLKLGDAVHAKVVSLDNGDGYVELSLAEADKQKTWQAIKEIKEANEILIVKILGANSGGLITEVNGIKAFLPVSQLSNEHYPRIEESTKEKVFEELKKFVDQDLRVRILDFNPRNTKLIVSEREITDENVRELLTKYKEGDIVDGIVSGVADFGAFIKFADTPEIEGLVHISELDHRLIEHPKEIVKVNDMVKAKITEIKDGRVSLSLKALKPDPWAQIQEKYAAGQEVEGTVHKLNPFGAFIDLDGEIQGLIHVSEFGGTEEMKQALEVGATKMFLIDAVKPEEKRIVLKLKK